MVQTTQKQTAVHKISQRNLNRKRHGTTPESVEIHHQVMNYIKEPSKEMNIQPAHLLQSQSRLENYFQNSTDVTHGTHSMRSYVRLSFRPPLSLVFSLSSLLSQGRGSCCIPYSQLALSFVFLLFVSLFGYIICTFYSHKITVYPHVHFYTTPISSLHPNQETLKRTLTNLGDPHPSCEHDSGTLTATFTT